jgi:hypothetical protein
VDVPGESSINLEQPDNNDPVQSVTDVPSGPAQPNSMVNPAPDTVDSDQREPSRRSLRGRIPRWEWAAMLTADQRDDPDEPYEPDQCSDAIYCPDSNKWKTGMMDE